MFGITHLAQIPLRKEPKHASEMVSQLLFGECYTLNTIGDEWSEITTHNCQYKGWVDSKALHIVTDDEAAFYLQNINVIVEHAMLDLVSPCSTFTFPIFKGSTFAMSTEGKIYMGTKSYQVTQNNRCIEIAKSTDVNYLRSRILSYSKGYLNAPYLWGGRTPVGIDCSGLVQNCYKSIGYQLARDASQQQLLGKATTLQEAQPGDVAFFANKEGKVTHTGILINSNSIIHASICVKIEPIDDTGIVTLDGSYSHELHSIKSYL